MTKINKTLKFDPEKADLTLAGEKTTTWRLFDDKNLTISDEIVLIRRPEQTTFAKAVITNIVEKRMRDLNATNYLEHQRFGTDRKMYQKFSDWYQCVVNQDTVIKIIKFRLVKQ